MKIKQEYWNSQALVMKCNSENEMSFFVNLVAPPPTLISFVCKTNLLLFWDHLFPVLRLEPLILLSVATNFSISCVKDIFYIYIYIYTRCHFQALWTTIFFCLNGFVFCAKASAMISFKPDIGLSLDIVIFSFWHLLKTEFGNITVELLLLILKLLNY